MMKIAFGVALAAVLQLGSVQARFAGGDGLDRDAAATGSSTFAGQHRYAASRWMGPAKHHRWIHRRYGRPPPLVGWTPG
jgi:hypothetical protein